MPQRRRDAAPAGIDDVDRWLADILAVEDVPGAVGIGCSFDWPHVTLTAADGFGAALCDLGAADVRRRGTNALLSLDEHLRIVHTPKWVTAAAIHETIAIAGADRLRPAA